MFGEKKQWLEIGYSWLHPSLCLVSSLRLGTNFFLLSLVRDGYNVYHCVVKWWTDNNETAAVWSCFVSETYTHTHIECNSTSLCCFYNPDNIYSFEFMTSVPRVRCVTRVLHLSYPLNLNNILGIWNLKISYCKMSAQFHQMHLFIFYIYLLTSNHLHNL